MDDPQLAQYPAYGFESDMMKRSMDPSGGPDSKKARWSPTGSNSGNTNNNGGGGAGNDGSPRDAYANYGYGPQTQQSQPGFAAAAANNQLYSTASGGLTVNTQGANGMNAGGMQTMTPTTAQFAQQQGQASPVNGNAYGNFAGGYGGMLGMGMPMGMFPYAGNFQGFQPQRLPSLQIPTNQNQAAQPSPYSPALLSAVSALTATPNNPQHSQSRTVYIGNLPPTASVDELLNLVHFGPLESIRVLPEKSCVFLSFLDQPTAAMFHADASIKKLSLHNQELKIGWGKASPVPAQVQQAIAQSGASRNVYLGGLEAGMSEEQLRDDLSRFGLIDQVKIVRDKGIGFVHFLSIGVATKVVNALPLEPAWAGKRVNYGKDRCAYVPKSQQAAAQQAQAAAAQSLVAAQTAFNQLASPGGFGGNMNNGNANNQGQGSPQFTPQTPSMAQFSPSAYPMTPTMGGMSADQLQQAMVAASTLVQASSPMLGGGGAPNSPMFGVNPLLSAMGAGANLNRTVYLGNIHPETTTEDLCNAIRGGVLQSIRYMQDKHIAFVTFIDPTAAFTFFHSSSFTAPLTLNNRRLKIGWGKPSGPLSPQLALAVHGGATRNVYIGNIPGEDLAEGTGSMTEEKLKRDFGEWGEVELVNFLREKNCAFVNFTNISNAIKAIEGIKSKPEYANLRIAHGKDRCANPPRSGPQGGSGGGGRRTSSAAHPNNVSNGAGVVEEVVDEDGFVDVEEELDPAVTAEMHVDETAVSAGA